ncbi:hypothetical protein JTB14_031356 [Gonioctena quinquepunctata]|nr:hypothetical protein JTB14_031356 [Gonioctena quinquepunctata]
MKQKRYRSSSSSSSPSSEDFDILKRENYHLRKKNLKGEKPTIEGDDPLEKEFVDVSPNENIINALGGLSEENSLKQKDETVEGRNNLDLIEALSDSTRLIADLHYKQSTARQNLVSMNLDQSLKDMIEDTSLDGFLFGDNSTEHLETNKAIERAGVDSVRQQEQRNKFITKM